MALTCGIAIVSNAEPAPLNAVPTAMIPVLTSGKATPPIR